MQKFDPALGTLTDVEVFAQIKGTATGDFNFCILRGTDCANEEISFTLKIDGFPGAIPFSAQSTKPLSCTGFEGDICMDVQSITLGLTAFPDIPAGDFALYTGVGAFGVEFNFAAAWTSKARVTDASASDLVWRVTYSYEAGLEPVPLPASLPLLVGGAAALWGLGRSGKGREGRG